MNNKYLISYILAAIILLTILLVIFFNYIYVGKLKIQASEPFSVIIFSSDLSQIAAECSETCEFTLSPGNYYFQATRPGFNDYLSETININAFETVNKDIQLIEIAEFKQEQNLQFPTIEDSAISDQLPLSLTTEQKNFFLQFITENAITNFEFNQNQLYYLQEGQIKLLPYNQSSQNIVQNNSEIFTVTSDGTIYYLNNNSQINQELIKSDQQQSTRLATFIRNFNNAQIIASNNQNIAILDKSGSSSSIYLIDSAAQQRKELKISNNIASAKWLNQLLIIETNNIIENNFNQIVIYNPQSGTITNTPINTSINNIVSLNQNQLLFAEANLNVNSNQVLYTYDFNNNSTGIFSTNTTGTIEKIEKDSENNKILFKINNSVYSLEI